MNTNENHVNNLLFQLKIQLHEKKEIIHLIIEDSFGKIDITSLIGDVFLKYEGESEIDNWYNYKLNIQIKGKHEYLTCKNNFPNLISFDDQATVSYFAVEGSMVGINNEYLKVFANSSSIDYIFIQNDIKIFSSLYEFSCKYLLIESNNQSKIKISDNLYLQGKFEFIVINNNICNLILINVDLNILENTLEFIESKIELYDVSSEEFFFTSHNSFNIMIDGGSYNKMKFAIYETCSAFTLKYLECVKIDILIERGYINEINIKNVNNIKSLIIAGSNNELIINTFNLIYLRFVKEFYATVSGINFINTLSFIKIINSGEIIFSGIKIQEDINIFETILGNTLFFNCILPTTLNFHSSNIEEVKFYNSTIPESIRGIQAASDVYSDDKNQSAYRQLKIAFEKRGSKIISSFFYTKELDAYYSTLSILKRKQIADKITIRLNKLSNNHGTNWFCPIVWLILICTITFFTFLWSLGAFWYNHGIYIIDSQLYRYYLDWFVPGYLYPTRNKLAPILECFHYQDFTSIPLLSKAIVFINDILILPYLIYQFISAFRRHGTK